MFYIYYSFKKCVVFYYSNLIKYKFLFFFIAKCGGTRRASQGTISSPKYPGSYEPNMDCEYRIITDYRLRIILNFNVISLNRRYPSIGVGPEMPLNETYDDTLTIYDVEPFNNTSTYFSHLCFYISTEQYQE